MDNLQNIAVLIDADNTQLLKMEAILNEISTYGRIVVKRAYGNWKKTALKNWENEVKRLAIKTVQQFDYVSGKNTTDIVMVIDAMDMLHERACDAFVLVTSDSDFTPLAIRLRESGAYIIGAGEKKTPDAFKNSCDDFVLLEFVPTVGNTQADASPASTVPVETIQEESVAVKTTPVGISSPDLDEIHNLLKIAAEKYQDTDGFANIASAGQYIKRAKPDFTPLAYGYSKLPELLMAFPTKYKITKYKGKGTVNIVAYKCL